MKKTKLSFYVLPILLSSFFSSFYCNAQDVTWAKNFGGSANNLSNGDRGMGIALDVAGNVYTTGNFQNSANFGSVTLTNPGQSTVYVAKQDNAGNVLWSTNFNVSDASVSSMSKKIAVDGQGNVYTTGRFYGITQFGGQTITPIGQFDPNTRADIFLTKQDASGNVIWMKNFGGSGVYDEGSDIAVDAAGNIYLTGNYDHSEFAGYPSDFGGIALPSTGSQQNIFVCKLNAAGDMQWAKAYGNQNYSYETAKGIAVDNDGNIYITGTFSSVMVFDGVTLTAANTSSPETYVVKLNDSGTAQWATRFYGASTLCAANGITVSPGGKVYVIGDYDGSLNVGTTLLTSSGPSDIFVAGLNAGTGSVEWAKKFGSNGVYDNGYDIASDANSNIYIIGSFQGTLSLGGTSIASAGSSDAFIARLSNNGTALWGKALGGSNADHGTAVALKDGSVYATGHFFSSTAQFGTTTLTSFGGNDAYVTKIKDNTLGTDGYEAKNSIAIYPNPAKDILNIFLPYEIPTEVTMFNMAGQKVYSKTISMETEAINVGNLTDGLYFVTLENAMETKTKKVVLKK